MKHDSISPEVETLRKYSCSLLQYQTTLPYQLLLMSKLVRHIFLSHLSPSLFGRPVIFSLPLTAPLLFLSSTCCGERSGLEKDVMCDYNLPMVVSFSSFSSPFNIDFSLSCDCQGYKGNQNRLLVWVLGLS